MGRYRKKRRRPAGYRSAARVPIKTRSASDVSGVRSYRKKRGGKAFIRRNYKLIAAGGLVVIVAVLCVILFIDFGSTPANADPTGASSARSGSESSVEPTGAFDEAAEYAYEDVDQSILEGLAGTDESLFDVGDAEMQDALLAEEGIRIGVTFGEVKTDLDERLLFSLEEAADSARERKTIYDVYFNNAGGDYNQQMQDVFSLIKNEADVIIVGATEDEKSFAMITTLAADAGIPVVAVEAPVDTGYAVNVVADQAAWGKAYGDFMAKSLTNGKIVQILGSGKSAIDNERESAINSALARSPGITTIETKYAEWDADTAKKTMTKFLKGKEAVDGVITEEGMAEGVLDAYIAQKTLPKVMCGDATAGFIKKWYALKHRGINIAPPAEDGEEKQKKEMFKAQKGEMIVCAQPAPTGVAAAAFEIALRLAQGQTLKTETVTYKYAVSTRITDSNLDEYYALVKDQPDSYVVPDEVVTPALEALFNPAEDVPSDTAPSDTAPLDTAPADTAPADTVPAEDTV